MVELLLRSTGSKGNGFEKMIDKYADGCNTSQTVQNFITCLHEKIL